MGLGGCYSILKYLVFIVNLIFWISGLTVIVLSVWMLFDPTFYISIAQHESDYYSGVYLFLIIGTLMFIVGFWGCCGTIRESQCMLVLFFCFLLIILVAEISAAAWVYTNGDDLKKLIKRNVKDTVLHEYGIIKSRTALLDAIQKGLECCGAKGPSDWVSSKFNNPESNSEKQHVGLAISSLAQQYKIPLSCCTGDLESDECINNPGFSAPLSGTKLPIFSEGCGDKLVSTLQNNAHIFIAVGLGIAFCQIMGLIFSLILCCGIQKRDRYKA